MLFLSRRISRGKMRPRSSGWEVHLLVFLVASGLAAAGIPAIFGMLEPFAFWGRSFRDLLVPLGSAGSGVTVAVLKRFDLFLAPIPFRGEPGAVVLTAVLVIILVVLTLCRGRWYCNRICPAGFVLRSFARFSLFKIRFLSRTCTSCGLCARTCRSGCISVEKQNLGADRCVLCLDCLAVCPVGALEMKFGWNPREKNVAPEADPLRRKAVLVTAGTLAAGALAAGSGGVFSGPMKVPASEGPNGLLPKTPVIPPGAGSLGRYTSRCISCHTCVSACPTHVLQPSFFALGIRGFLQPVMDYRAGYCEWECRSCTEVCPTGAILPLELADKKNLQLGRVQFDQDRCVVFTDGTACGACAEVCPTQAVRMIPHVGDLTQPLTDTAICSGCGSCEHACPVEGLKAIYVHGITVHVKREERERLQIRPVQEETEEFPF